MKPVWWANLTTLNFGIGGYFGSILQRRQTHKKSVSFVQNGQKHLILACILTSSSCTTLENKGIYSRLNLPLGQSTSLKGNKTARSLKCTLEKWYSAAKKLVLGFAWKYTRGWRGEPRNYFMWILLKTTGAVNDAPACVWRITGHA